LRCAGAVGSAARGALAPTEGGAGRGHIVAAARLQLVIIIIIVLLLLLLLLLFCTQGFICPGFKIEVVYQKMDDRFGSSSTIICALA